MSTNIAEPTIVEVEMPDGTSVRWAVDLTDEQIDNLTSAIEAVIGPPATIWA